MPVSSVAFTLAALVVGYDHLAVQLRRSRLHHELLHRCPTLHWEARRERRAPPWDGRRGQDTGRGGSFRRDPATARRRHDAGRGAGNGHGVRDADGQHRGGSHAAAVACAGYCQGLLLLGVRILHRGQRDRVRVLRMLARGRRPKKRQHEGVYSAHLHLGRGHGGAPLLRQRRRRGVRSVGQVRKLPCRVDEGLQRLRQILRAGIGFHRRLADSLGQSAGARHTLDGWPPQEIVVGLKVEIESASSRKHRRVGVASLLLALHGHHEQLLLSITTK